MPESLEIKRDPGTLYVYDSKGNKWKMPITSAEVVYDAADNAESLTNVSVNPSSITLSTNASISSADFINTTTTVPYNTGWVTTTSPSYTWSTSNYNPEVEELKKEVEVLKKIVAGLSRKTDQKFYKVLIYKDKQSLDNNWVFDTEYTFANDEQEACWEIRNIKAGLQGTELFVAVLQ